MNTTRKYRTHKTDEHGDVIHCEVCDMNPATREVEHESALGTEWSDLCDRMTCWNTLLTAEPKGATP